MTWSRSESGWVRVDRSVPCPHSDRPDADAWLAQAVADADELRAAIDHLERAGLAAERLQLVADAMVLWFGAGHEREGERLLDDALVASPPDAPARAIALAYLAWFRGRYDAADLLDAAMRAFDDESLPPERVVWFVESAVPAAQRGDDEAAAALVRALDEASARTGVAVPPWERRLLDGHAGPDTV